MNAKMSAPQAEALPRAHALEARHYLGAAMHEPDRRAVFAHSWQLVAHREQLAEPGDHVVESWRERRCIVLRGRDGVLRAFPNVCRHRAGPLAHCSGKGMHNLRCKYHGWLYDQEGRLIAAPEMQDAADFATGDIRLPPLRVREWQGLVFVALRRGRRRVRRGLRRHFRAHRARSTSRPCGSRAATCSTWPATGRCTWTTSSRAITCRWSTPGCRGCWTTAPTTPRSSTGIRCSIRRCATPTRSTATARRSISSSTRT